MLLFSKMEQFIQFITILLIKLSMLFIIRLLFSVVELILSFNWFFKTLGKPRLSCFVAMLNSPEWKTSIKQFGYSILEESISDFRVITCQQDRPISGTEFSDKLSDILFWKLPFFNTEKYSSFEMCHRYKKRKVVWYVSVKNTSKSMIIIQHAVTEDVNQRGQFSSNTCWLSDRG